MSNEHKAALAEGRSQGRCVRAYLEALENNRPKRGRKRTKETIERRLAKIGDEIDSAAPLQRLQLIQERIDLEEELGRIGASSDVSDLENEFVRVAKAYAERKGITYSAFRELGVSAAVLKRAGISRAS